MYVVEVISLRMRENNMIEEVIGNIIVNVVVKCMVKYVEMF